MCSIAVFNYAGTLFHHDNMIEVLGRNIFSSGITVMKELTATTRAVLDQIRVSDRKYKKNWYSPDISQTNLKHLYKVVLIYIVFLMPFGPFLCKERDHFVFVGVSFFFL